MFVVHAEDYMRKGMKLPLGRQGENLARYIRYDMRDMIDEFGQGTFEWVNQRSGEVVPYIVTNISQVDTFACWNLTNVDTAINGDGQCELRYYVDNVLCKTIVWNTIVTKSLGYTGEVPDPYENLLDQMAAYAAQAQAGAESAASSAATAGSAAAEAVAPMQAQLDEAIAGATVDSEVINARVDENGTTHATLGQRLNTEFGDLKNEIGDLSNLDTFDKSNLVVAINEGIGSGLTSAIKEALLACFEKVAWIDSQGQIYYDALHDALYPRPTSITAVFTQGDHIIYDTQSLNDLKQYLVVTATFADGTEQTVTRYTLSGTLEEGTSTITVTYMGCTDTFDVIVTENAGYIIAEYTQSGSVYDTDSLDELKSDLIVTYYENQQTVHGTVLSNEDYALSGTLEAGTSTITASYIGLTDTFSVTVTADPSYIAAVYTQSGTVYTDDNINDLKSDLVVTYYDREGQSTVLNANDYTLSGTLVEGTSTITVAYSGLTTTFTVANVIDWYNIWRWEYPGNMQLVIATSTEGWINPMADTTVNYHRRRVFVTSRGKKPYYYYGTGQDTEYYMIPVPPTATRFTLSANNSNYKVAGEVYKLNEANNTWSHAPKADGTGSAGMAYTTNPATSSAFIADSNLFLTVLSAYEDFPNANEPTSFVLEFE